MYYSKYYQRVPPIRVRKDKNFVMNDVIIKSKQIYVINLSQSQPRYLH